MRLLPVMSLMMNSQESSATGYTPYGLFMGRLAWFLHAPYPEDSYSTLGKWVMEQQDKVDKAKAMLQRVRERQWNKKSKHRVPASYQEGDWVLVHGCRLPAWPCSSGDDPYFGSYKILLCGWSPYHRAVFSSTTGDPRVCCSTAQALLQPGGPLWGRMGTK